MNILIIFSFVLVFVCSVGKWYKSHRGIFIFHEALQKAFPLHNIDCKLLCTTDKCQENQFAHTDNKKWTCRFLYDPTKHVCEIDGHTTCHKDTITHVTIDMCLFSVFLALEDFTSLIVGNGFDYKTIEALFTVSKKTSNQSKSCFVYLWLYPTCWSQVSKIFDKTFRSSTT